MEDIQQYYLKKRYTNELNGINHFMKCYPDDQYEDVLRLKNELQNKLKNLENKPKITQSNSQNDLNSLFDKIDKKVQMQDWKRIPKYIQNEKIKNYVDNKCDNADTYKLILDRIKKGKIKSSHVKYNKETCEIDHIENIS